MSVSQVLVVDDETAIRQVMASYIKQAGYLVDSAKNGEEALSKLAGGDFDIVVCDINMPDITGIDVVRRAGEASIEASFIMMTAYASMDVAIEAMRAGAHDFIIKPVREEDVLHRIALLDKLIGMRNENRALRRVVMSEKEGACVLESQAVKEIDRLVAKVAPTDNTVLITGESGVGKGMVARDIHMRSNRADAPFIPVNCGAIPENLVESEFFGHVKGAFTGAVKAKKGLFLEANGGTIFLDEIGELPLGLQVKLLHVIESKEIRPVGHERTRPVDVRIVTATNRDLPSMVKEGTFREDLYFRINVFHVDIPSLKDRKEDVATLIKYFTSREAGKLTPGKPFKIDPEAEELLLSYDWPGNVRELENVVSRAVTLADNNNITIADLPPHVSKGASFGGHGAVVVENGMGLREQVQAFEGRVIEKAIQEANGDRKLAAERLDIGLSSLYRKLDENEKTA